MKKIILIFIIGLTTQSLFAQSKFWGGVTVGAGNEWYVNNDLNEKTKREIEHIGLAFKYNLSDKFALRTGFNYVNKYFNVFEFPMGVEYSVIKNNRLDLVVSSGLKINSLSLKQHDYLYSGCLYRNDSIYGELDGLNVKNSTHLSLYNGFHARVLDQFDLGITLNSGFYNFIELRSKIFVIQDCSEAVKLEEEFMNNPDKIFRNSYLSVNLTYWIRKQDDEKKHRLDELGFNRKNFIYFELLGAALIYSLNYERILFTTTSESTNFQFLVRTGVTLLDEGGFLLGVAGLVGNKDHYFELGAGGLYEYHPYLSMAYRFQKNAFFGRGGIYFIKSEDFNGIIMWPGFSFGVAI